MKESQDLAVPETFIVQKNVTDAPTDLPMIDVCLIDDKKSHLDTVTLSVTSSARERRRQNRLGRIKNQNQENEKSNFIELLQSTMKQKEMPEISKIEKSTNSEDKPALLAGEQTMTRFPRLIFCLLSNTKIILLVSYLIVPLSVSRVAQRMATLQRDLYNELGSQKLTLALDAVIFL